MSDTTMQKLFDANVRLEKAMYLPATIVDIEALPEQFKEFCRASPDKPSAPLYVQCPRLAQYAEGEDWPDAEDVAESLRGANGFLFEAATPVRDWHGDYCDFSWGHYYTAWLYASSESEIAPVAIAWATERSNSDRIPAKEPRP